MSLLLLFHKLEVPQEVTPPVVSGGVNSAQSGYQPSKTGIDARLKEQQGKGKIGNIADVTAKLYEVLKYETDQQQEIDQADASQTAILARLQSEGYGKPDTATDTAKTNAAIAKILAAVPEFVENQNVQAVQALQASIQVASATQQELSDDDAYMLMALAIEVMA